MMSSEEETEFGLYTDKLLKKAKRTRQRVDAGEPRNSYSSIPNFSSRPSFLGGNQGLYGAIFTQQQHFGLFAPGFGPAKMLNELLGSRTKPGIDPSLPDDKYGDSDQSNPPPATNGPNSELAHHMLRDILQGRMAEHAINGHDITNPLNNNNNNIIDGKLKPDPDSPKEESNDIEPAQAMHTVNRFYFIFWKC